MKRALSLIALCAILYAHSLSGAFHYDDFHSIVDNPHVRDWRNIPAFFVYPDYFSVDEEKSMYRPLLLVSYTINYAIGAYRVEGYRVFNVLIHGICSLLVALLAESLLGNRRAGWAAGLFFAVHPLATEPVNYISSRSESLAACFYLTLLVVHLRVSRGAQWASALAYGAGLLVKSITISAPLAAYSLDAMRERIPALRRYMLFALGAVGYGALVFHNRFIGDSLAAPVRSLASQAYTQLKAPAYYFYVAFMPVKLSVVPQFFSEETALNPAVWLGGLFVLSLVFCLWLGRKTPIGWCLLWATLVLVPTFVMPLNMLVNERRLYMPLAALAIAIAWCVGKGRVAAHWGVITLSLLAVLTFQRSAVWSDGLTLWRDAQTKAPQMHPVQNNLGKALQEAGLSDRAIEAYKRAIEIDPRHGDAYNNMATIHHLRGEELLDEGADKEALSQIRTAVTLYQEALIAYPTYEEIYQNLAAAHVLLENYDEAISNYEKALEINGKRGEVWNNYGQLLYELKRPSRAEKAFEKATQLLPDRPEPYNNLGNIYSDWQRWEESVEYYRQALSRSESGGELIAFNLTIALRRNESFEEARSLVGQYLGRTENRTKWLLQAALIERAAGRSDKAEQILASIENGEDRVLVLWGEVLSELERYGEALVRFSRALEGTGDRARILYGMGEVHMKVGNRADALNAFNSFMAIWPREDTRKKQVQSWIAELEGAQ